MRFSLRALLLAILVVAVGLAIFRLMRGDYPQGAITVVYGPRAGHPSGTPAWSVVRFDDRIVCRSADPIAPRTVFASPFPIDRLVREGDHYSSRSDVAIWMPFGVIGLRAEGTYGLLTVAPANREQQSVMTPYGPALPISGIQRELASPRAIAVIPYRPEPPWREWLSVCGDGADGVVVRVASDEPTNLSGIVTITALLAPFRMDVPAIRTAVPANGQVSVHFPAVPKGEWYAGGFFGTPGNRPGITAKPVCFEKRLTPQGVQVIEFR